MCECVCVCVQVCVHDSERRLRVGARRGSAGEALEPPERAAACVLRRCANVGGLRPLSLRGGGGVLSREEASVEAEASTQEVPQASELGIEACEFESLRLRLARVQQELLDSARLQVDDGCGVLDDLGDRRLAAAFRVRDATEALVRGPRGVERRCTARYDERSVRCIGVATVPRTDLILTYLLT